ncbi:hypothetical protein F4680DRAFT_464249 [Xylaria scruposa]|nr:hypothetical protein F4680DRAFT_464249 [Xylaria scruposa]
MHPPLIYCPRGAEFKFHIAEEEECHLYPHHAVASHLRVDDADAALSVSSSASMPPSKKDGTGGCTGKQTSSASIPDETTQSAMTDQQLAAAGRLVVNGSSSNQRITPSRSSNDSHKQTTNSWNRQAENFETKGPVSPYNQQQSSFNGYNTNSAYSGAPFDYRYHSHSDPQQQYYPYQQAPTPAIEYHPQTNLPRHVYMEVEGPGRHYQSQGSIASASSHFGYSGMFPEHMYGRNTSVPERNPLRRSTTLKSSFNPQAASFDYGKVNRNPLSNPQAAILDPEACKEYKLKCRKSLEQLERSNRAAYYNRDNYDGNQGIAISDDRNTDVEASHSCVDNLESSTANGDYSATSASQNPCSRSRSCSEPSSQQVSMSEASSAIIQEVNTLSHQDHESNDKGKGKEIMQNSTMSWSHLSRSSSSADSVASVGPWNGNRDAGTQTENENRDAGTQTDDHPDHYRAKGRRAISCRHKEVVSLSKASQSFDKANSHGDLASTGSTANSESTNLGILSVKTESGDEGYKAWDQSESTPTKVKMDPDDEIKLHDIPSAPARQGVLDSVRSDDSAWDADIEDRFDELETPSASPKSQVLYPNGEHTPKSTSECESRPIKQEDTTHQLDVRKNDMSRSGTPSTHRSTSNVAAPSSRSWSAVVSGRYIPSKDSDPCSPQPTIPASSPCGVQRRNDFASFESSQESLLGAPGTNIVAGDAKCRPATPIFQRLLLGIPNQITLIWRKPCSIGYQHGQDCVGGIVGHGRKSPISPNLVAPASPARSTTPPQLPESALTASASTSAAPEPPKKPQPRAWSQVLGGSEFVGITKSDSSKDEANWPSLGSSGSKKGPKRNTTS